MDVKVFICGAGPTGLLLACILKHYAIPFCIIDKKPQRTQTSNALGIHARTLELLEDLGLATPFLELGRKLKGGNLYLNNKKIASIDLTKIASHYPFAIILPQSETEKILDEHLRAQGVEVLRGAELIDFKQENNAYRISYMQNNTTQEVKADYLIGCDGAHSKVRELSGINFTGDDIEQPFALADCKVTTTLDLDHIHTLYRTHPPKGLMAMFPLPNGEVRIVADLNAESNPKMEQIDIAKICKQRSEGKIKVNEISWQSHFWIHSKAIEKLRKGNIFFAGDAAHIHSPFGGQGMNTGMQDVYNLGWKLNLVINHNADPKILESYQVERYPVIQDLIKNTEKLTHMLLTRNPVVQAIRDWFFLPMTKMKKVNLTLASQLAMLTVHYQQSPLVNYKSTISNHAPAPGSLVPEIELLKPHHLKEYLHSGKFCLLIFAGTNPTDQTLESLTTFSNWVDTKYKDYLNYHIVTPKPLQDLAYQLNDDENLIAKQFKVVRPAYCLVRPDKYIALCANELDQSKLESYFGKLSPQS